MYACYLHFYTHLSILLQNFKNQFFYSILSTIFLFSP